MANYISFKFIVIDYVLNVIVNKLSYNVLLNTIPQKNNCFLFLGGFIFYYPFF